jgi:mannose-6-phosphate isomerase-like protein (cupin superfamily)
MMSNVQILDWNAEVGRCTYDEKVGIRIAKLTGNADFCTYITFIDGGKHVNPHYHKIGDEHYHIISGEGVVKLRNIQTQEEQTLPVKGGESFLVPPNTEHQLINKGKAPLVLMFSCPEAHLSTDRFFA